MLFRTAPKMLLMLKNALNFSRKIATRFCVTFPSIGFLFQVVDHLLFSWPSTQIYFVKEGKDRCDKIGWKCLNDQQHGLRAEAEPTLAECNFYLFHHVFISFIKPFLFR